MGGIKTNISLFRRILSDEDFKAARLDTGYLDRLMANEAGAPAKLDADVAAIAAGLFTVLDAAPKPSGGAAVAEASAWKRAARAEVLR